MERVSLDLSCLRRTAQEAAGAQHYPQAALYVIATPIGNLADITLRALHVLQLVDAIACEDTRHTQVLLRAYGIEKPLLPVHEHNEQQAAQGVLERLQLGQRVAYVSDAGTPAVSDPGARLVVAVRAAGCAVVPLPGASSVTALLSVAGITDTASFVFMGFLSSKKSEREQAVQALRSQAQAVVLLEAPHRIQALADALTLLGQRQVTVGRELTKQFEEIATLPADQLPTWLAAQAQRMRGEFVLVLHPTAVQTEDEGVRVLQLLLPHLSLKTAVQLASDISGEGRKALYALALTLASQR